jgi:HSP20 family protein
MNVLERHRTSPWTDVLGWLDDADLFGRSTTPQLRVEDFVEDHTYVIRADLPGVDPERDLDVHVEGGRLVVKGERREEIHERHRSEVHYGAFSRILPLPAGVDADEVTATYTDGVLEVLLPLGDTAEEPRQIPVSRVEG